MKVLKFGGTSVGTLDGLKNTLSIIETLDNKGECKAVVISAFSKVTDTLIQLGSQAIKGIDVSSDVQGILNRHISVCEQLLPAETRSRTIAWLKSLFNELLDVTKSLSILKEFTDKSSDFITSFGERASAYLVSELLNQKGIKCQYIDAREIIITDSTFGCGIVDFTATNMKISEILSTPNTLFVVTGYIATSSNGDTTTLGRGGSDYTAAILGAAFGVDEIEIWTDVDGIMTADPRIVPTSLPVPSLSYSEAMELSHFGAKVIYPPTIRPALENSIPVRIRNTFKPNFEGSLIQSESADTGYSVTGISSLDEVSILRIQGIGIDGITNIASRVFAVLSEYKVNVILTTQASSEQTLCLAISPTQIPISVEVLTNEFELEISRGLIDPVIITQELSIISVVGENMQNTPGVSARFFNALGTNGINIIAIAQGSSELNISAVVSRNDRKKALNAVHDTFFLADHRTANLFIVGDGLIGSTLLEQINQNKEMLLSKYSLDLKVSGVTNTRTMKIDGKENTASLNSFIEHIRTLEMPHCILVDCTASELLPKHYSSVLNASVSIVTPNKRGLSGTMELYQGLKSVEKKRGVRFLYETCVGAGLPVISTLHDLLKSGDRIVKIEAVLSGTLSFLFNMYDGTQTFASAVLEAQRLGYTEPDPRDDLSGTDVARKVLILAREIGLNLELKDIEVQSLVPKSCAEASNVEAFYKTLEKEDKYYNDMAISAKHEGKKLRYVGIIENGKASTQLLSLDDQHPFYSLSGSDNIISFTSDRYSSRPLVVKGPGAGPAVTAAGVLADIIRIIH